MGVEVDVPLSGFHCDLDLGLIKTAPELAFRSGLLILGVFHELPTFRIVDELSPSTNNAPGSGAYKPYDCPSPELSGRQRRNFRSGDPAAPLASGRGDDLSACANRIDGISNQTSMARGADSSNRSMSNYHCEPSDSRTHWSSDKE